MPLRWRTRVLIVAVVFSAVGCTNSLEEVLSVPNGVRSAAASSGTVLLSGNVDGSNLSLIQMPEGGMAAEVATNIGFDVPWGGVGSMVIQGTTGAGFAAEGITLFEAMGPTAPRELSKIPVDMHPGTLHALCAGKNLLVLAYVPNRERARTELVLIDIGDPEAPKEVGRTPLPEGSDHIGALTLRGNLLLVAARLSGLFIYDVEDPASPELLSHFDPPLWARGVDMHKGVVYLTASANPGSSDILVIDIGDPRNPEQVTSISTRDIAQRLVVSGDRLYVADRKSGLRVYDITSPRRPRFMGRVKAGSFVLEVAAADGLVVAWNGLNGSATVYRERY